MRDLWRFTLYKVRLGRRSATPVCVRLGIVCVLMDRTDDEASFVYVSNKRG